MSALDALTEVLLAAVRDERKAFEIATGTGAGVVDHERWRIRSARLTFAAEDYWREWKRANRAAPPGPAPTPPVADVKAVAIKLLNAVARESGTTYCLSTDLPVHVQGEAPRDCQVCHDGYVGGREEAPGK